MQIHCKLSLGRLCKKEEENCIGRSSTLILEDWFEEKNGEGTTLHCRCIMLQAEIVRNMGEMGGIEVWYGEFRFIREGGHSFTVYQEKILEIKT